MDRGARGARRHRLRLPPPAVLRLRHVRVRARQGRARGSRRPPRPGCRRRSSSRRRCRIPSRPRSASTTRPSSTPQVPAGARRRLAADARSTSTPTRSRSTTTSAASVKTPGGRVIADRVVVATHYPFLDRSLAFARVHPQRSYALACRIAGAPPAGMYISGDSPTRSVRAVPRRRRGAAAGRRRGPPHGRRAATPRSATGASSASRASTGTCESVEYRWSAQDNTTVDGVPYVGRAHAARRRGC